MPRRDQTGPSGQGSLTGRQMGQCSSSLNTRTLNNIFRNPFRNRGSFGFGGGQGLGQQFRNRNSYPSFQGVDMDKTAIENDIKILKEQLKLREEDLKIIDE